MLRRERRTSWLAVMELGGMAAGLLAGATMLVLATLLCAAAGEPVGQPLRLSASILLHEAAIEGWEARIADMWLILPLGLAVHAALCLVYGFFFGLVMTDETRRRRPSYAFQAIVGMAVGLGAWLLDVQLIARIWYPWFLEVPAAVSAFVHVVGFGLPLGLFSAAADRRLEVPNSSSGTPAGSRTASGRRSR